MVGCDAAVDDHIVILSAAMIPRAKAVTVQSTKRRWLPEVDLLKDALLWAVEISSCCWELRV